MISVDDALALVAGAVPTLTVETVATTAALGRVLATPVHTAYPMPMFEQSAVDGYAVRHADITNAPVDLPLGTTVAAAPQSEVWELQPGTAARILTGGLMPNGADTIVRQELAHREAAHVRILETVAPGADVRHIGHELPAGALVAEAGARVTPGLIGALASVGAATVEVRGRPRVHVLVTGDELVPLGASFGLGQIPDSNGPLVAAHLERWDCPAVAVSHVVDDPAAVRAALDNAFSDADIVITSGGVSVGDFDFIPSVAEELGAERVLWKVAQRPGMPLYVARRDNTLLFGLPGNPGAVLVNLHVYVRFALDIMLGLDPARRWQVGPAPAGLNHLPDKTFWLRVSTEFDASGRVTLQPLDGQGSHTIANLAHADALVHIPATNEAGPLDQVAWTPLTN